jgi:hypothetical protein
MTKNPILDWVLENVPNLIKDGFSGIIGKISDSISEAVYVKQKMLVESFFYTVLLAAGIIFISIAFVLILNEFFRINFGLCFFIVGLFLITYSMAKKKYI